MKIVNAEKNWLIKWLNNVFRILMKLSMEMSANVQYILPYFQ